MFFARGVSKLVHAGTTGDTWESRELALNYAVEPFGPAGLGHNVERFVRSCVPCARYKRGKPPRQGGLCPILTGLPFEVISLDLKGPHPKSSKGYLYILTAMDHFTKYAFAEPMRNQEARVFLDRVFPFVGLPRRILTDQGTKFESLLCKELCRVLEIDKVRTSPYHPSGNSMLERFHRTLNSMIGKVVSESQRDWDVWLPTVMSAYRASTHSATGYGPNFLVFGRENGMPADIVTGDMLGLSQTSNLA